MDKQIKIPGPDHPITLTANPERVTVTIGGKPLAETVQSLILQEASYKPVQYIPRRDVDMAQLERSDHKTYCPYKGECSYFSIPVLGERGVNAVWSYEAPYDAVSAIKERLAFYPDRVEIS